MRGYIQPTSIVTVHTAGGPLQGSNMDGYMERYCVGLAVARELGMVWINSGILDLCNIACKGCDGSLRLQGLPAHCGFLAFS